MLIKCSLTKRSSMVLWQIARMGDNMIDIIPKPQETGEAFFRYHGTALAGAR